MKEEIRKEVERIRREWNNIERDQQEISKAFDALITSANKEYDWHINNITVADAIARIRLELEKDKAPGSYYYAWQANIAMCFYDAYKTYCNDGQMSGMAYIHEIANKAAINFLTILCSTNGNNTGLTKQEELQKS